MAVDIDLAGQRLLVVGGSSGIGRSTALAAAAAGAEIVVVGRSEDKLKEVVTTAGKGTGIAADVRDPERCFGIVAEAVDAMGGIDALVFSTAVSPLAPLDEATADTWHDVITTNAIAPALARRTTADTRRWMAPGSAKRTSHFAGCTFTSTASAGSVSSRIAVG